MNINNSQRLSFRLMDKSDKHLLWQLDQNTEVMKFITGGKLSSMNTIEQVFIPRMEAYRNEEKGWGLWQVNRIEDDSYLGWILIRPMHFFSEHPEVNNLEIGWRFFQHTWGKGYATEAALQVMHALTNYNTFSAIADENNHASINVMKKLGMKYIKTYHHKDQLIDCQVAYYQINK